MLQTPQVLSRNIATLLVYGRPVLAFAGLICAITVMLNRNPYIYTIGVLCLFISMVCDLVDGWFAARFTPQAKLAHLAERIMDKILYSIIFPLIAVGMMWRYHFLPESVNVRLEMFHIVFVLLLSITVLIRDSFAHFMRNFSLKREGEEPELKELTRLRTVFCRSSRNHLVCTCILHQ